MSVSRFTPRMTATALIIVVAVIGAAIGLSSASAQTPGPRTLTFTELGKGSTFKHIRNTKPKTRRTNATGDLLVLTNPIADASGTRIGSTHVTCITTVGARNFTKSTITCTGVLALRDGTLTIQGDVKVSNPNITVAVTGGTGAYANARGVLVSRPTATGFEDTITFAD